MVVSDERSLAKRLLLDAFPGMRIEVHAENPQYAGTETYRSLVITYNADMAAERGINQRHMREVLKPVVEQDSVQYGTKTIRTPWVSRISFKKTHYQRVTVNPERVQEMVQALTPVETGSGSNREAIWSTVEVLKDFVPRVQQPVFEALVQALKDND